MNTKTDRRAQVRFSAAKFRLLPMDAKLAYLRDAFEALRNGKSVIDLTATPAPRNAARLAVLERQVASVRLLTTATFERLPIDRKMAYLERLSHTYRRLQRASRQIAYFATSAATALPISSVPTEPAPGPDKSAVRKPRASTARTARRMRSSPSRSSKE